MPVSEYTESLTLREASERFNIPVPTLRQWIYTHRLQAERRGTMLFVKPEDVERIDAASRRRKGDDDA